MNLLLLLGALTLGYLLGSVSFAVMVAKSRGVDIFKAGSGNPGATNVKRVLGAGAGNLVFFLDFLKGLIAGGWPLLLVPEVAGVAEWAAQGAALAGVAGAILGHSFSVFLRFRGGKGVATTIGGLFAVMPLVILIGVAVWLAVFFTSRYVSLASIFLGLSLPVAAWALRQPALLGWFATGLAVLILVRHRANIRRLLDGTESRFERKNPGGKADGDKVAGAGPAAGSS